MSKMPYFALDCYNQAVVAGIIDKYAFEPMEQSEASFSPRRMRCSRMPRTDSGAIPPARFSTCGRPSRSPATLATRLVFARNRHPRWISRPNSSCTLSSVMRAPGANRPPKCFASGMSMALPKRYSTTMTSTAPSASRTPTPTSTASSQPESTLVASRAMLALHLCYRTRDGKTMSAEQFVRHINNT